MPSGITEGAAGPLAGIRVIELASLAPAPFGCMMLADLGADVIQVERPEGLRDMAPPPGPLDRGKTRIRLDLKDASDLARLKDLACNADVFVEGFRPGVTERLGIGPADLGERNPGLVYARMTGWGQTGPLASRSGHDINYIALAGILEPIGRAGERPHAPLNILADFAGGGMLLVVGVLAALAERVRSGRGQVVDAAMIDGAGLLTSFLHGLRANGLWSQGRGQNLLDGGAYFYDTYECRDGRFIAVGCVEEPFCQQFLHGLGLGDLGSDLPKQLDAASWEEMRRVVADRVRMRTRQEWAGHFADSDACVSPVLTPWEAADHPHQRARQSHVSVDGLTQPAPAPRFSRTPAAVPRALDESQNLEQIIGRWRNPLLPVI